MIETRIAIPRLAADVLNPERVNLPALRMSPEEAPGAILAIPLANRSADAPQILAYLNAVSEQMGRSPWVREITESILPAWTSNNDLAVIVRTVTAFVRDRMRYLADPEGGEYFIDPITLLQQIAERGYAFGDCDDHVGLLNAMLRSVGLVTRAAGVHLTDPVLWDHVITQVNVNGEWLDIDPCVKSAETPNYREKLIYPVDDPNAKRGTL